MTNEDLLAYAQKNFRAYLVAFDGKFLGHLTLNKYDAYSVFNPYGNYGSKYSPVSIHNPYSQYGSKYSSLSPYNVYTSTPPVIYYDGRKIAVLTKNNYVLGEKVDPDELASWLQFRRLNR